MNRRWYVSDFQRIIIYIAVVAAVFLAAMALGWQNIWLLLAAVGVLVAVAVSVLTVAGRRGAGAREIATARVLSVSSPPPNTGIAARCDMQLEVLLPGRAPVRTRHRDPAVPLTRWPQPGQTFPVDVLGGNPRRHLHIRWDLVEQGMVRAPDAPAPSSEGGGASPGFVWEEENEPIIFSPTPPRPRRPPASTPSGSSTSGSSTSGSSTSGSSTSGSSTSGSSTSGSSTSGSSGSGSFTPGSAPSVSTSPPAAPPPSPTATAAPAPAAEVFLHETFTDLDEATVPTPAPPAVDRPRTDPNGYDPDGYDPADFETPRLAESPDPAPAATGGPGFETIRLSDFDPADVDIRDFVDEPPAVTAVPPDDEPPADPPSSPPTAAPSKPTSPPSEPTGTPSEPTTPPAGTERAAPDAAEPAARPIPQPRGGSGRTTPAGTGITTRPVADLDRALRFYRDVLGFGVVFTSAKSAVVEYRGSRVLLDERSVQPSPGEVHLDVTDIEKVCAAVRAGDGEVIEAPAPVHSGTGMQLWRARLRDPDGHAVEVIEWRNGEAE